MTADFRSKIAARWSEGKFLCVGLDPDPAKMPAHLLSGGIPQAILAFNRAIVDATRDIACSYKPNTAFYEAYGEGGWRSLRESIRYIKDAAPDLPVIVDAKRADIGNTNQGYVEAVFTDLSGDAITVHPYLGAEALAPFLERPGIGVFVLCRTSNQGAGELQDLRVGDEPLYQHVARIVATSWNARGNCGLVVGATYPEQLRIVRSAAPELPLLIPGIGAQGGDLKKTVQFGRDSNGAGMIISSSRSVLYASNGTDFAEAARRSAQEFDRKLRAAAVQ